MIELELNASQGPQVWGDGSYTHVIVEETEDTAPFSSPGAGFYVRDEGGENGPYPTLARALDQARALWGEVELAPAVRLRNDIELGRADEIGDFLLEYLATYGTAGIDAQALARRVFERIEELD